VSNSGCNRFFSGAVNVYMASRSEKPAKPKRSHLERELEALRPALADPESPFSRELLRSALRSSGSFAAAKAASVIRERLLSGFEADLKAAFNRFLENPVKTDPGCKAKLAALEALDYLETQDTAPFEAAVRYFQSEPTWGKPVDTAAAVRARGALGLARQGQGDFLLLMADLLADSEAAVRQTAAEAIAYRGEPAGAGLLALKLRQGDEEPLVTLACLSGLLTLAPAWALPQIDSLLNGHDESLREVAALALGQSRREDALDKLLQALAGEVLSRRRSVLLRSVGLHRSDRSLAALLRIVAEGSRGDAEAAIEALAARRLEPGCGLGGGRHQRARMAGLVRRCVCHEERTSRDGVAPLRVARASSVRAPRLHLSSPDRNRTLL
jgi:hypothetical protein